MSDLINTALLPLQFPFMQQAMIMALLLAVPMALLSCFLVLKGWAMMGDAITHAVLPGIVLAYLMGLPLVFGAFVTGLACAVGSGYIQENSRLKLDVAMGVLFSGLFALGLVLYLTIQTDVHLDHILFGNLLGIDWGNIKDVVWVALLVIVLVLLFHRDLFLLAFDPVQAGVLGLNSRLLHYGLLTLLCLAVVIALEAVGLILAIAFLICPGASAYIGTRRFGPMMLYAVVHCLSSSLMGVYLSFWWDVDPASLIVLIMTALFLLQTLYNEIKQRIINSKTRNS